MILKYDIAWKKGSRYESILVKKLHIALKDGIQPEYGKQLSLENEINNNA